MHQTRTGGAKQSFLKKRKSTGPHMDTISHILGVGCPCDKVDLRA